MYEEIIVNETNLNPDNEVEIITDPQPKPEKPSNSDVIIISRTMLNYAVIAVVFLIVGVVIGAVSFSRSTTVDKDLIQEAVSELMIDAGLIRPVPVMETLADDDPYLGEEDAPIIIVEFSAYACPFCGRHYQETFQPLLENYGDYIRYVYRDYPVINQSLSVAAALAANCANEQGAFWDYHDLLFLHQSDLQRGTAFYMETAEALDLDTIEFSLCYESQRFIDEISNDYNDGSEMQLTGTPAFFINGEYISGAQPYDVFEEVILRKLEEAGIQI
jgi:protein-disulfide isomerase